jgi:16S rRNA A1518/A1519 N6-dimethyltransferase RsmA/KsgA/DIM1 with predicted DNA glycosylase/AP lyase activity
MAEASMTRGEFRVSAEAREVLKQAEVAEGSMCWTLKLPARQLPRNLYVEVNKVLEGVGGVWSKKARVHVFDSDPRPAIALAVDAGTAVNEQQAFQSFYTPKALAKRVVDLAEIEPGMTVLEPSAGEGALADEVPELNRDRTQCVELNEKAAAKLQAKGFKVMVADFLRTGIDQKDPQMGDPNTGSTLRLKKVDRVIMNPPFANQADIDHVLHAFHFLKPGGVLVAVMNASQKFRTTKKTKALQKLMTDNISACHDVAPGTFEDTDVATVIVRIQKKRRGGP